MKEIILGLKLLKYGYKIKLNLAMLGIFIVIATVVEIRTHGTNLIGAFYYMIIGMFAYQLIVSMDISEYVQSTSFKRKLQVSIPTFVSTIIYMIIFTGLVIERHFLMTKYPEEAFQSLFTLTLVIILMFCTFVFTSICYKYFIAAFVLFMALVMGVTYSMNYLSTLDITAKLLEIGLAPIAVAGYVVILLGGLIEYIITAALYKKPLSEFAFRGIMKDM